MERKASVKLAVCVPAYNDLAGVLRCLNSLHATQATSDVAYYVQDDASPAVDMRGLVPESLASVERNEVNLGFAGNVHRGVARSSGDIIAVINQDVYAVPGLSDGWDAALLAPFEDARVAVVAPRLLFPNGAVQSCGGAFDQLRQPVHRALGWANADDRRVSTPGPVPWATGAALAIRRAAWDALGGFDRAYRMYWEDLDFCLRVGLAGGLTWYVPACTLIHQVGSTGGSPHFLKGALLYKSRWVDTGMVAAGPYMPTVRFW
jgi:GT2 family glycosyltransferase